MESQFRSSPCSFFIKPRSFCLSSSDNFRSYLSASFSIACSISSGVLIFPLAICPFRSAIIASTSLESPSMLCSRSPVVTSSSIAASTTDSSSSFPVSFSYASNVPTSAAVPESGNGPATITLASSTPAVASAFLYMPAVQ